ncbi:MAG TPA: metallophosphoesterase [Candidatus Hydrogenedentes bacterium]|nr:metallophosphoesterase [Candidatus Hydrogenedentota bacterium]
MKGLRKKKLLWLAVLAALAVLGWKIGPGPVLLVAGMLAAALGALHGVQWVLAGRGLAELAALRARHGFDAMAGELQARLGGPEAFRFVVMGDTRNNTAVASRLYKQAAGESPAVLFHTGDIVRRGNPGEFLRNHVPLLPLTGGAPLFCVPGNHDQGARRDFAAFKALYGDDRFSLDFGGCRFVGFNNCRKDRVDDDTLAWLRAELSKPGAARRFVFLHIPPVFFEETFAGDTRRRGFRKNQDAFHALMRECGVDEVFMAHIHGYATHVRDGVRYTLTAGGGAPLSGRIARENRNFHYVALDVSPEGLRRTVVYLDGDRWARREE